MKLVSIWGRKDNIEVKTIPIILMYFCERYLCKMGRTHQGRSKDDSRLLLYSSPIFLISNTVNTLFLFAGFDGE